jgi:predicted CXXCH cytochrome family protein
MRKTMQGNGSIKKTIFFYALIIFLIFVTHNAYSAQNQVYAGDGAVINRTVPPGGWLYGQGGLSCLVCHNPSAGAIFRGPDKTSYLKTGHKNILRRAQDAPVALTGPDGNAYTADGSGNVFNWTNNTINILGSCSNSSTNNQGACTAGGGVWISGSEYLYYILGGWMVEPAVPMALYDGSYTQGTQKTAVLYSCARCHTTGYTMDAPVQTSNRNPEASFQGISWTPSRTTGTVDFDPDGDGPAIAGSWVMDGIQCERCHDATDHGKTGKGTLVSGVNATALCMQCHRQEHTLPYAGGGLGSNIVPTPYTDNGPLSLTEPLYPLPAIEVGGYSGYAKQFYGYSTGMEFLNGAHGKYTGNFQQIGDTSYYGSTFINEDPSGGGCTTCHDVHQSTVTSVNASAPFKKTCSDCHVSQAKFILSRLNHPQGAGTPLVNGSDILGACIVCHMPRPNDGIGASAHIFRINVISSYSTFPTLSNWNSGKKTANTSADAIYTGAVWLDVDMVCGQCHGGSDGTSATKNGAPFIGKSFLANYAKNMHSNVAPTVSFTSSINNYTITLTDTSTNETEFPSNTITINWGDGKSTRANAGATVSHTYATAGKYKISFTVKGAGGLISNKKITVTVPQRFSIIVNLDPALPDDNAVKFILKKKGVTKAKGTGTASYTFSNQKAGIYQIQISKSGYTFDGDNVTEGNQNPVTVTVGSDQTLTFTHTP